MDITKLAIQFNTRKLIIIFLRKYKNNTIKAVPTLCNGWYFFLSFQNAGVHLFSFFVLLLGSAVLLENTTTGSEIVSSIRESMMNLMMQSQNEYATNTLNMIQESVSKQIIRLYVLLTIICHYEYRNVSIDIYLVWYHVIVGYSVYYFTRKTVLGAWQEHLKNEITFALFEMF